MEFIMTFLYMYIMCFDINPPAKNENLLERGTRGTLKPVDIES
jgi:hypothetical protein